MVGIRRTRIPLSPTRLQTGLTALRALIQLELWTPTGFQPFDFLVDSGAGISMVPIQQARRHRIPHSSRAIEQPVNTAAGKVVHVVQSGFIRVRIPGFPGREF